MNFKGTKGDWTDDLLMNKVIDTSVDVATKDGTPICTVWGMGIYHPDIEEARVNARLIASAPDLLEALQDMVRMGQKRIENAASWSIPRRWFKRTYAAVEKGKKAINKALKP